MGVQMCIRDRAYASGIGAGRAGILQTTFYEKRYSQTDPHRKTDFVKLAEGFGLKGYRCRNLPEFQAAFALSLIHI